MAIDAATVRKVAHLARIKTPEDRLEPLAQELNGILAWIEQLDQVDVEGVEPMTSNVAQPLRRSGQLRRLYRPSSDLGRNLGRCAGRDSRPAGSESSQCGCLNVQL